MHMGCDIGSFNHHTAILMVTLLGIIRHMTHSLFRVNATFAFDTKSSESCMHLQMCSLSKTYCYTHLFII